MFLSGETLRNFVLENQVIIPPADVTANEHLSFLFDKIGFQLTVGDEVYSSSTETPERLGDRQTVTINPGEFTMVSTAERLKIPSGKIGFVSMKFFWTGLGLINVSGFHVNPGFSGNFVFAVYNAGPTPVTIRRLEPMFMLFLAEITDPQEYEGEHQGQVGIPVRMITTLKGPPVSLRNLADRVSSLENYNRVFIGVIGSLLAAVIAAIFRLVAH